MGDRMPIKCPDRRQWSRSVLAVVGLLAARPAAAQTIARVEGVAFDSLTSKPIAGALVSVRGTARSTFTDAQGRFTLDSVPYGRHRLDLSTPLIEQRGLGDLGQEIVANSAVTRAAITFPSFETIARRLCGTTVPPAGAQTILVGAVRDARTDAPVARADVEVVGRDMVSTAKGAVSLDGVRQRTWTGQATADSLGTYALCGLPEDVPVSIAASRETLGSGIVESTLAARTIVRQDLWLAPDDDDTATGIVRGTVTDAGSRRPIADVQVLLAGADPTRTNSQGQYVVTNSPLGTRAIEFRRVGADPVRRSVSVRATTPSIVDASLQRVTRLEPVRVAAVSARQQRILDMEYRRDLKLGYFVDSTELRKYPSVIEAMRMASGRDVPCAIYIDGVKQPKDDFFVLKEYRPDLIAQIEVHGWSVPIEYQQKKRCPVLLMWTKLGLP
jgi:hypothetical protein